MEIAKYTRSLLRGMVLMMLLTSLMAHSQELWPGMETYLKIEPDPGDTHAAILTNLYSSPLVAFSEGGQCPGRPSARAGLRSDAAATFAIPWSTGQATTVRRPAGGGCTASITSAIFADGKEMGDPEALAIMHDCRHAKWEEIHRTLMEDIFKGPLSQWNPDLSLAILAARREPLAQVTQPEALPQGAYSDDEYKIAIHACHIFGIDVLISSIKDYQTSVASDPAKYGPRRLEFLAYLKGIQDVLASPTYPAVRTWWKRP